MTPPALQQASPGGSDNRLGRRTGFFACRNCGGFWGVPDLIFPAMKFEGTTIPATWSVLCECGKLADIWKGPQFPGTITVIDSTNAAVSNPHHDKTL